MAGAVCCKPQLYPPQCDCAYNQRMEQGKPAVDNGYVEVYEAADEALAIAILDLLRQAGIAAVPYPYARGYAGIVFGDRAGFTWGEIVVPIADEEQALELIGGFLGTMGMLEEAELEPESETGT